MEEISHGLDRPGPCLHLAGTRRRDTTYVHRPQAGQAIYGVQTTALDYNTTRRPFPLLAPTRARELVSGGYRCALHH